MRAHASSIFSTLQKSLHGSCQVAHRASVYVRDANGNSSEQKEPTCRVVLHHAVTPMSAARPQLWSLEETELRLVKFVVSTSANTSQQGSTGPSRPTARVSKVQFSTPPSARAPPPSDLTNLEEIHDLCLSFERLRAMQCGKCLGYLVDATMDRHALYWPEKPLIDKKSLPVMSLADVLTTSKPNAHLSGGDTRRLAAALAFGMLRLHDTPWLTKEWNHADITFFEKDGTLLTEHPFISTDVQAQSALQQQPSPAQTRSNPMIRNETVFALGILLIELCMETSFYELQKSAGDLNPDGSKHVASDVVTANRMLDKVYAKFGARYGDAVRRCILCEFDQRQTSLEDEAFRRAVYDNVVTVLDEEVRQFFGQTM
nr:hypothetical protein CFP56_52269 [Quercus suber]